ncbi:MAG: hypothetical protein Q7S33_01665 [Nanoarchaeota archaeon]|nr:hypothetical protein [Nanoarchaeota archaeon]
MKIALTPDWFLGIDVLIEIFSFMILFLFFILCLKNYRLSKNKNSLYIGLGFFAIALAEIFTILTKLVLYYDTSFTQNIGHMVVTYNVVKSVDIFYYIGFFLHKLFTLMGLYIIYKIPTKKGITSDFFLVFYFLIISALFGNFFFYLFHITALLLLILIIGNYQDLYQKNKSGNTKTLLIAFAMLSLSQIIFILSHIAILYAIAQTIQLISYVILLILIVKILEYGKKKKQVRHNI